MTCRIEPVSRVALEPLALLHAAAFPEDPWSAGALAAIFAIPGSFGYVAWADKTPAGFVLARDLGGECEILSLGVVPDQRRRSIGQALLQAALDEARRRGLRSAVLEVAVDNALARALYTRAGFLASGRRAHYYRRRRGSADALIMRAPLGAAT